MAVGDRKYLYIDFTKVGWPVVSGGNDAAGNQTVMACDAAGDEQVLRFSNGAQLLMHNLGSTQANDVIPAYDANGLNVAREQTDDDGIELATSVTESGLIYTVGTDPAFFAKLKFSIADVSGTDDCAFGFRKAEAFQANIDDYDEAAFLNVISGDIKIETILNNAATVTTDTTDNWADTAEKTLEVYVSAAGVATFKISGSAPTTTAAYTFDDGEKVVPFFYFLHDSDLAGNVYLKSLECGYQELS
jgi:hypothetical protein